jgi:4'-phosphopantetheinyl transferase
LKVSYLNINDLIAKQSIHKWLEKVPKMVQDDVLTYRQEKDQWRVLGGKLLLIQELSQSKTPQSIEVLKFTEKGKPFFETSDFHFNISHSGDFVALVTTNGPTCGIDIECHRKINWQLFQSNFTSIEWQTILNANDARLQFFDYWAIKESVIKADGRGVVVLKKTEIVSATEALCDGKKWHIKTFEMAEGYSGCVASANEIEDLKMQRTFF